MGDKLKDTLVIIVNGKPESGKTYLCDEFIKRQNSLEINSGLSLKSTMYTPIDRIKECAKKYFGWNGTKDIGSRSLLADLYQFDIEHNNETFKDMINFIDKSNDDKYKIIFINIRNIDQITLLKGYLEKDNYYVCTMYIYTNSKDSNTYENKADDNVEYFDYDIRFENYKNHRSFCEFFDTVIYIFHSMKAHQN